MICAYNCPIFSHEFLILLNYLSKLWHVKIPTGIIFKQNGKIQLDVCT